MSLSDKSTLNRFSRDNIIEDYPMEPFVLKGPKRILYLVLYIMLVLVSIFGCAYAFYLQPIFFIFALFFCYLFDNFLFAIIHLRLHGLFIEIPENKMNVIEHHSFIHHYRNTKVYHENWLESRIAYFIDPRSITSNKHMFFYKITFNILTSFFLYIVNPVLGISYFSGLLATNLIQSITHEWYHNPKKNRKNFYNPVTYYLLSFLEKIKIASSKRHLKHHLHNLHTLEQAEAWLDLYTPAGELLASKLWRHILTKYVPGQYKMTQYMTRIYESALIIVQIFLPLILIVCFYFLVGFP